MVLLGDQSRSNLFWPPNKTNKTMEKPTTASTIVVLNLGSLWTGRYAQAGSEKVCAMLFIENKGLFVSSGFKSGMLVKGIMLNHKEDKKVSQVAMKHSPAENEPVACISDKDGQPLDWKDILNDLTGDDLEMFLKGGMFFPFNETLDAFWNISGGTVSIDMFGLLSTLAIIRECGGIEPDDNDDWNKMLADYMFVMKNMMRVNPTGVDIMKNTGAGFAPSDVFSVATFMEMIAGK